MNERFKSRVACDGPLLLVAMRGTWEVCGDWKNAIDSLKWKCYTGGHKGA